MFNKKKCSYCGVFAIVFILQIGILFPLSMRGLGEFTVGITLIIRQYFEMEIIIFILMFIVLIPIFISLSYFVISTLNLIFEGKYKKVNIYLVVLYTLTAMNWMIATSVFPDHQTMSIVHYKNGEKHVIKNIKWIESYWNIASIEKIPMKEL
jgi:hypothetical protein